jgi:cysteinyl-tRNA synthetase
MEDDFNTPEAFAVLFEVAKEINREKDAIKKQILANTLRHLGSILGFLQLDPETYLQGSVGDNDDVALIESLIKQRNDARAAKNWADADAARDKLNEMNIVLEDGPQGTTWRRS